MARRSQTTTRQLLAIVAVLCSAIPSLATDQPTDFYTTQIQPLLKNKCFACHGPLNQEADLRLDTAAAIKTGGDSGPAIDLDNPANSLLLERLLADDPDERMPPETKPLTPRQIEKITRWIKAGAHAPKNERPQPAPGQHWAFQPITHPSPPNSNHSNPIDAFIHRKLQENGLDFSQPANPTALIRRFYFDLHGLPPTPNAIDQFNTEFANDRAAAVKTLVDQLLDSSRYGERWAQHWLDVVRYADTDGFEVNTARPNAWHYRDFVIRSFNEDQPYDQFVFEQLAGDSVGNDPATGFLVAAAVLLPGQIGKDAESIRLARQDALDEIIVGTSATFLGLTVGCARCHDHKFDPISQQDYYAMQAFFAGVEYGERPLRDDSQQQRAAEVAKLVPLIAALKQQLHETEPLATPQTKTFVVDKRAPQIRAPVNPAGNVERFKPVMAKQVRFTVLATNENNRYQPCLDELQVLGAGDFHTNLGLASNGTTATSSGNFSETGQHQLKHINDGKNGNSFSWISNEIGKGWVQLELPNTQTIDHIEWARDRSGKFKDRLATEYRIEVSIDNQHWTTVADSTDRLPLGTDSNDVLTPEATELTAKLKSLEQRKTALGQSPKVYAGKFREPDETYVLSRGNPEMREEKIAPRTLNILGGAAFEITTEAQRRIELAHWIASPDNPLTARVIVNRVWQYHFGQGLVDTPSDFGLNGVAPTHPELLDWLANELIENDWSIKHLHQIILASTTYQQSSAIIERGQSIDADARLLWRYPARRLEAEAIRDCILSVSGQLKLKMGGPGFNFFKTRGGLSGFPPLEELTNNELRRMIYAHKVRMERAPVFGAFDCPDAGQPTPKRSQSTTAIQALNLLNSTFVAEQATRFADHVQTMAADSPERQIELAFRQSLGRAPTDDEMKIALPIANQHGLATVCRALFNSNEFLFFP